MCVVCVCVCVCVCECLCVCVCVCVCTHVCARACAHVRAIVATYIECAYFIFVICSCHHIALLFYAANITREAFFAHHTALHDTVKSTLVPATMDELCPSLASRFYCSLMANEEGDAELMEFVRVAMFSSVVRELFGEELMPMSKEDMHVFMQTFVKFDEDFEYGAQLPEIFLG